MHKDSLRLCARRGFPFDRGEATRRSIGEAQTTVVPDQRQQGNHSNMLIKEKRTVPSNNRHLVNQQLEGTTKSLSSAQHFAQRNNLYISLLLPVMPNNHSSPVPVFFCLSNYQKCYFFFFASTFFCRFRSASLLNLLILLFLFFLFVFS